MLSCGWDIYLLRIEDLKRETTMQSKKSSGNNWKKRLVSFNSMITSSLPSYKKVLWMKEEGSVWGQVESLNFQSKYEINWLNEKIQERGIEDLALRSFIYWEWVPI